MSLSMMVTSTSRASSDWLITWPNRPKPMISTLPDSPSGASTPSSDGSALGANRCRTITNSGVSAIDSTTMLVRLALTVASMTPLAAAAANSTNANSPPCAISTARSSASAWLLRVMRATT